ncbi:oxidoreductase-like protein [Xylaria bambusicola]|uniref:oxidoreductase-like protein n=1 Tax=Xylaria bambusicola TaxID=326684 RepID=UPI0020080683|nr:oxidoreductase-like protein [Xylaria bambusicola]KAI0509725.1 oxidoreductase-like protein [Xylaria bambusicola]
MPPNMKPLMRVARLQSALSRTHYPRAFASKGGNPLPGGTPGESSTQAMPIGPYYESMLTDPQPIPKAKPEAPPASSPKSPRAKKAAAEPKSKANDNSGGSSSSSSTGTATSTTTTTSTSTSTSTTSPPSITNATTGVPPQPSAEPATAQEKARIIFGSRLAGPAERADRLQAIRDRSTLVAGVLVPPRPEEPDNCCMSGCVNCVWDRYGEELEEWAAASTRAEAALQAQQSQKTKSKTVGDAKKTTRPPPSIAMSMDDDGGGSESHWRQPSGQEKEEIIAKKADNKGPPKIAKDLWDDELYSNVPVGIREFMKQERRLKKKHEEEGTFGA